MHKLLLPTLSCLFFACSADPTASEAVLPDAGDASFATPEDDGSVPTDAAFSLPFDAGVSDAATDGAQQDHDSALRDNDAEVAAIDDAVSHYELDWLRGADAGYVVRASSDIAATVDRVWGLVRDVNNYASWSPTLSAHADSIAPGQPIALSIQLLDPPFSKTDSEETIEVVDDARHAIAWTRDFGNGQTTLRFQIVEPSARGARYTTGLKFPPDLGGYVQTFLGMDMQKSFDHIALELSAAAQ